MHQGLSRRFNPLRFGIKERAQSGMPFSGGEQIGLHANLVENLRRIELLSQSLVPAVRR